MVQRFELAVWEQENGDFVYYHEFKHIESENARLREILGEMTKVLERFACPECDPASTVCRAVDGLPCEVVMLPRKAREVLGE